MEMVLVRESSLEPDSTKEDAIAVLEEVVRDCIKEGIEKGMEKSAINLLKMDVLSPEQIAQASGLPLQKVLELQEEIKVKV